MFVLACKDSADGPQIEKLQKGLGQAYDQVSDAIDKLKPEADNLQGKATSELEKLFIYEYRVENFPNGLSSQQISNRLNDLGKDRWDCFHIEPHEEGRQVFCKRMPRTVLRYLRYFPNLM